jgi:peptidoglycan/LPS O-acetylase OafA/YrhL
VNPLVRLFLALVVVNAAIGSAVLLAGGLDGTGGKVFATSLLATGSVLVGSVCSTGWRSRARRPVAAVGMVATAATFGLLESVIWWSIDSETVGKCVASTAIVAVASAGSSLLGQAMLAPRHRWVVRAADALGAIVVGMALLALWAPIESDVYLRVLGVLCVGLATLAIVVPVLHRADRSSRRPREEPLAAAGFCPHCGAASPALPGSVACCPACSWCYIVRFLDNSGDAAARGATAPAADTR